ncbi:MAG: ATP synthase subunit a [Candidatus Moranbacteria bacterium GW2011_GWA2_39_41]|nr:MAG: ATP synthase subunit a [Candidatus Moranbacteria bacterium GW2011_GWA2_39_41]
MSTNTEQINNGVENQEVSHEATLFAEPIFHIGSFTVTNALLNSWATVVILVILFILIGKKIKSVPKGLQNVFEVLMDEALKLADSVTGNRKKTEKFLPIALTLFLFILVNNWLGLLPGVGTMGFIENGEHGKVFVPLFRGATADLNMTLALSLFAVVASHVMGVIMIGVTSHLNKFLNVKAFLEIPKKIKKDISVILVNPIKAFVGLIEIIGEIAKVASLSFRLFGNIFAGEVLMASMMAIFAFILPLPFIFMEIVVGVIQALIFAMLTMVFMTIATTNEEH